MPDDSVKTKAQLLDELRELRESEERYQAILEDMPGLICRFLPGGEITYVNKAYCMFFAKTPEELLGASFLSVILKSDRETVMANLSTLTVESPTQSHEHQVIAADGEIRWQRWASRAMFDGKGRPVAYQSIGEDITERKRAAEVLPEFSEYGEAIVSESPFGITIYDAESGQCVVANKSMATFIGASVEELLAQNFHHIASWKESGLLDTARDALRDDSTKHCESNLTTTFGKQVFLDCRFAPFWVGGAKHLMLTLLDITERKKAEDAVWEKAFLLESASSVIAVADLDGNMTYANPAFLNVWGIECLDEVLGRPFSEFWEVSAQLDSIMGALLGTGPGQWLGDLKGRREDGSLFDLRVSAATVLDIEGKPIALMSTSIDIAERKRAEEALHSEKLRAAEYIDSLPGLFYVFDDQRFVKWNREWNRITGYSDEELAGRYGTDFFEGDDRRLMGEQMLRVFREGTADVEALLVTKDGRRIPYYLTGTRKKLNGQEHLVGLGIDITERKQAEEALRASEGRLRSILDNSSTVVFLKDLAGEYLQVNRRFEQLFHISNDAIVGKTDFDIFPEDAAKAMQAQDRRALEEGGPISVEEEVPLDDGTHTYVSVKFPLLDSDGAPYATCGIATDITGRKKAEDALRESEERYRGIFDESVVAVYVFDSEKNFIDSNQAGLDLLGYSREELLGMSISDVDTDREAVAPAHAQLQSGDNIVNYEHQLTRKDGAVVTVLNNSKPLTDDRGCVFGMQSTLIDVTERKQAEETLAGQTRHRDMLLDSLPHPAMLISKDRMILSSNRVAIEVGAIPGKKCWQGFGQSQFIPEEDKRRVEKRGASAVEGTHCSFCRADECLAASSHLDDPEVVAFGRIWDTHWVPLDDETFLHYAVDVTDERNREGERNRLLHDTGERVKELRCMYGVAQSIRRREALEEVFRDTVALIPPGWQHPEGTRARIRFDGQEYVSEPFEETEWQQTAALSAGGEGRDTLDVFYLEEHPAEDDGPFLQEERELIDGIAQALSETIEHRKAEGERAKAEEQLRQAQKMEAIGTLAGGIAHDFNNILYSILGFTEMAAAEVDKDNPAHEMLKEVEKASKRAAELVEQILAISRKEEKDYGPVLIHRVVEDVLKMLQGTLPSTIAVVPHIDEECGAVTADATEVHQIILNLCTNAYHAMRERRGTLSVELRAVHLDKDEASQHPDLLPIQYVRLAVADTGFGMAPETMARIFEPYFTTKDTGEGTGLGLATVHGIVRGYGGAVTVDSSPGQGSTFTVFFPRASQQAVLQGEEEASDIKRGRGERILAVDDEEALALLHRLALEHAGYRAETFTSAGEALEAFRSAPQAFDLVLTDQTMPKMTGVEFSRQLLQIRPDIPIILCTGHSDSVDREKAMGMGIRAYLKKPIVARELANTLRRLLDQIQVEAKGDNPQD